MYKRYIKGKSFVKIADEMHYDFKYTTNLNGIALNEFDKLDKVVEKNGWIKTIKYDLIIIAINDTVELERVQAQDCILLLLYIAIVENQISR